MGVLHACLKYSKSQSVGPINFLFFAVRQKPSKMNSFEPICVSQPKTNSVDYITSSRRAFLKALYLCPKCKSNSNMFSIIHSKYFTVLWVGHVTKNVNGCCMIARSRVNLQIKPFAHEICLDRTSRKLKKSL